MSAVELMDFPVLRGADEEHSTLFGAMNRLMALPDTVIDRIRLFTDEQVLQMRGYAREWGAKAWLLECACDAEIMRRDKLRGGRGLKDVERVGCVAAVDDAAREAGVSRQTIYRNAQIFETFFAKQDGETVLIGQNSFLLDDKGYYEQALRAAEDRSDRASALRAIQVMAECKAENPYYSVRDAREDVERLKFAAKQRRLASLRSEDAAQALGRGDFPVVYADPPWRYEGQTTTPTRFIERQYPTMDLDEICALPVGEWAAKDAILFLWATSPKLEEALRVLNAWGFTYRTNMVWVKDRIGLGHWVRQQHELLLIGRRGNFPTPADDAMPSSVLQAPRREHSQKPDEMYEVIERMYPGLPYLELFARQARPGWTAYGNEAPPSAERGGD